MPTMMQDELPYDPDADTAARLKKETKPAGDTKAAQLEESWEADKKLRMDVARLAGLKRLTYRGVDLWCVGNDEAGEFDQQVPEYERNAQAIFSLLQGFIELGWSVSIRCSLKGAYASAERHPASGAKQTVGSGYIDSVDQPNPYYAIATAFSKLFVNMHAQFKRKPEEKPPITLD